MRVMLYENLDGAGLTPSQLIAADGPVQDTQPLAPIVQQVQRDLRESAATVHWKSGDDETINAIPLTGENNQLMGILLVGSSRQIYVELRGQIRSAALLAAGAGLLLAVLLSSWVAGRVTRPIEELARAAHEVAGGNWNTQVAATSAATSKNEIGELADSFNRMTRDLLEQRERLVQSERVAAWRELARRLAHELKNPLFPLQLTVENLLRARQQSQQLFDETFQESSATLLAEIANLKAIISRFSEFSKMPQPQFQAVDVNEIVQNVVRVFRAQLWSPDRAAVEPKLDLASDIEPIAADPELLHRALSNLVLNAMDAMPQGGTLTLRTHQNGDRVFVEVSDTGSGLTSEECERLFTPYYTSKAHGTGLGLAIVQSIISDHGGRISVRSQPSQGATFVIELLRNQEKRGAENPARDAISVLT